MSNGKRSIGLFGISGVLAAALIIAAFVAIGGIFQAQGKGTITIEVTDAPAEEIENLWLTIDEVKIQGDAGWVTLELVEGANHFDLLALLDVSAKLAEDFEIPVGDYSMIQIHVKDASTTEFGEPDLTVPSNVIKVLLQPKLSIEEGEDATVLIDLQPDDVHAIANSHTVNIRPVVKWVNENGET